MKRQIPALVKRKITQESNSTCPFCGDRDVSAAEFHHIKPLSEGGESTEDNIIYTCSNCHSKITRGEVGRAEVLRVKSQLVRGQHTYNASERKSNVINVDFNKGVIVNEASNLEIRTTRSRVTINPPSGSIASSLAHKGYIKHLIDRYHEFKKIDVDVKNMNYALLYAHIKRLYGAKWDMVPLSKFEDLSAYLRSRIDRTKHGRIQTARDVKNYSDFGEYKRKYGFSDD